MKMFDCWCNAGQDALFPKRCGRSDDEEGSGKDRLQDGQLNVG